MVGNGVEPTRAEHTGFSLFKDKNIVVLYNNDLAETPRKDFKGVSDSLKFLNGPAPLKRCIGTESTNITTFEVPCCIVAYNLFMNSVDRFDKFSSTNCTMGAKNAYQYRYLLDYWILS